MFVTNKDVIVNDGAHILDGQGYGPVASDLGRIGFDPGFMRPYMDKYGRLSVTVNRGRWTSEKGVRRPLREHVTVRDLVLNGEFLPFYVNNATALRKEEWTELDRTVLRAARYRLNLWSDLAMAVPYGGFNAMSKLILEYETMADPGEAFVDMTGTTDGRDDQPQYQLRGLPLPIIHSDFKVDARKLAASRNSGTPVDATMGEAGGRRVGETVEKLAIGNQTGPVYGGASTQQGGYDLTSRVDGIVTYPNRLTKAGYIPTGTGSSGSGWKAGDTINDVLACLDVLRLGKFYGPWTIYHSNDWDRYMDGDYTLTGGNVTTQTLRNRLRAIKGVDDVKRLDFLFATIPSAAKGPGGENIASGYPFTLLFVQKTPDVIQAVDGMGITTVQWESKGGMLLHFKVMCIQVPRIRSDFYGNCGILQFTGNV